MEVEIPNADEAIELLATLEIYELETRITDPEEDAKFWAELQSATELEVMEQLGEQLRSVGHTLFNLTRELKELIDGHKKDNDEDPLVVATACYFIVPVAVALCEFNKELRAAKDQSWPHPIEDINKRLEDLDPGQQDKYEKLFVDARGRARWIDVVLDDCEQHFCQLKSDHPGLADLKVPLGNPPQLGGLTT